jgi:hypothetical protein
VRTNFRGAPVAAVLGDGVVAAGLTGIGVVVVMRAAGLGTAVPSRLIVAAAIVLVVMYAAGSWDDHKGDERPRGFKGHLRAARGRVMTGGIVKLGAGGVAGAIAGALLEDGISGIAMTAALVALAANAINLLDRAPGRASKVAICGAIPVVVLGPVGWWLVGAGTFGGVLGCLGLDLTEKGMLGDAGANPVGALVGLGIAVSAGATGRVIAVVALAAMNLASERWSFSRAIESNPVLEYLDRIGRK